MSKCDAINSWCGSEWPCSEPAVGRYRRACVHEHLRDGRLCQGHVDAAAVGLCLPCHELNGTLSHECAITLTLLEPDGTRAVMQRDR